MTNTQDNTLYCTCDTCITLNLTGLEAVILERNKEDVMASKKDVHTVHNGDMWSNKVNGEVVSNHRTKEKAVEVGRDIAKSNHSEHKIHRMDGVISQANSYGNDPKKSKG